MEEVANAAQASASADANIMFGASFDDTLNDAIEVVIIAAADRVISTTDVKTQNKDGNTSKGSRKDDTPSNGSEFEFYEMFNKKSKGFKDVF